MSRPAWRRLLAVAGDEVVLTFEQARHLAGFRVAAHRLLAEEKRPVDCDLKAAPRRGDQRQALDGGGVDLQQFSRQTGGA